jgi:hypothetical protein
MLEKIRKYWNENGFEILFIISVLLILILSLFRIGKKGTYSKNYFYNDFINLNNTKKRPIVKESKGETMCREILQNLLEKPFPKERPDFLRNPVTGGDFNLELDCYNEELKLALEYNGVQHYKYVPYFHKNKESFLNQKYRDEMKRVKCRENGVALIEVPYDIKHQNLEDYVRKELIRLKFIN